MVSILEGRLHALEWDHWRQVTGDIQSLDITEESSSIQYPQFPVGHDTPIQWLASMVLCLLSSQVRLSRTSVHGMEHWSAIESWMVIILYKYNERANRTSGFKQLSSASFMIMTTIMPFLYLIELFLLFCRIPLMGSNSPQQWNLRYSDGMSPSLIFSGTIC